MSSYHLFMIILFATAGLSKPVTTILHEFGHAVPAFLLTREKVIIYIGSYGNQNKSFKINLRIFEVWFTKNPFLWYKGLCVPTSKNVSVNKQIIYILSGPITSFVVAFSAAFSSFYFDLHPLVKFAFVILMLSSILDLLINLSASERGITLHNGRTTYNDGYQLKTLFKYRKHANEYQSAVEHYNSLDFLKAGELFYHLLVKGLKDINIYRLSIASFMQIKDYEKAKQVQDEFVKTEKMTSDDYVNSGLIYLHTGSYPEALSHFDKSLSMNSENTYALNNKGYTFIILKKYEEALVLFDKALIVDDKFAHSYNNRGFVKMELGNTEEGYADIMKSFEIDDTSSYVLRNLGFYHLKKGNKSEALNYFLRSKELDNSTEMIEELIEQAKTS